MIKHETLNLLTAVIGGIIAAIIAYKGHPYLAALMYMFVICIVFLKAIEDNK